MARECAAAREYISANAHLRDLLPHRILIRAETSQECSASIGRIGSRRHASEPVDGASAR